MSHHDDVSSDGGYNLAQMVMLFRRKLIRHSFLASEMRLGWEMYGLFHMMMPLLAGL